MTMNYIDLRRNIKIPEEDSNCLAEFFGILTGDGYIGKYGNNHVIEISGNSLKDRKYVETYVSDLFFSLFNIKPNINFRKDQSTMYAKVQSRAILEFLISKGFPKGLKGKIGIPKWIKDNKDLTTEFVKGMFDTDGCVTIKRKEGKFYPGIVIGSKSDILLKEIKLFLEEKDISSYFATNKHLKGRYKKSFVTYQLQINGYRNVETFFDKISSNNIRNISRFEEVVNLRKLKKL